MVIEGPPPELGGGPHAPAPGSTVAIGLIVALALGALMLRDVRDEATAALEPPDAGSECMDEYGALIYRQRCAGRCWCAAPDGGVREWVAP